jgi:hypothetical protein
MYSKNGNAIIFFIVAFIILLGCKAKQTSKTTTVNVTTNNTNSTSMNVAGMWQWVKTSCCGRTPVISTPQTENKAVVLNLKSGGTFEKTVNGNKTESGSYEVKDGMSGENTKTIKLSTIPREGYISILNDTLIINYGYIDLQTEYYKRVK